MPIPVYVIIKTEFDNSENRNPVTRTLLGYTTTPEDAQQLCTGLTAQAERYLGYDNQLYPKFNAVAVPALFQVPGD